MPTRGRMEARTTRGPEMFYLPDYEQYATDCVDEPADFDIEQIARDLRDALDGADPETMDSDEFWAIIQRNQL